MNRREIGLAFAAAVGLAAGCGHTHTVENTTPPPEESAATHPSKSAHPGGGTGAPVATSADALLAPGGAAEIRRKLKEDGFLEHDDASLEAGLRKFQAKHDLPETGIPDHATVAKLGLDPNKVFRQAEKPQN